MSKAKQIKVTLSYWPAFGTYRVEKLVNTTSVHTGRREVVVGDSLDKAEADHVAGKASYQTTIVPAKES